MIKNRLIIALLLMIILADMALLFLWNMGVRAADLFALAIGVAIASGFAIVYHHRGVPKFVLLAEACIFILLFATASVILMYASGRTDWPLIDNYLIQSDRHLGISIPAISAWVSARPILHGLFQMIYDSMLIQTVLLIMALSLLNDRRTLTRFMLQFAISVLITTAFFAFLPALGPRSVWPITADPNKLRYLEHLINLRNQTLSTIPLSQAEGMITFPSFHTVWACLIAVAFWKRWPLFWPAAVFNLFVILSVLAVGGHYAVDIPAGLLVAAVAIWISSCVPLDSSTQKKREL